MSRGSMVLTGVGSIKQNAVDTDDGFKKESSGINPQWANKAELTDTVAIKLGVPRKRAMKILNAVLASVGDLLAFKNKVAIKGFGTFESRMRKGRAYKHPLTGESVVVPDKETVVFKPSKNLLSFIKSQNQLILH